MRRALDIIALVSVASLMAAFAPAHAQSKAAGWSFWHYNEIKDPMTSSTSYIATVRSRNTVNFNAPYSGLQRASLMLRTHPRYGRDVLLTIERGQFLCHGSDGCEVLVRFDEQPAVKFRAGGPEDHSTTTLFLRNFPSFVDRLKKATVVRISANVYHDGAPVFEFDVAGFDQSKLAAAKK